MRLTRVFKDDSQGQTGGQSGIAMFMVISAMTILSVLVTEFVYIAQVNQRMAFDSLDQLKAHYLAKTGIKISLLRLKAYQNVKGFLGGDKSKGGAGIPGVPKQLVEKIWSFPFFYPLPTNIPGLSMTEKDAIAKFTKASGLEGMFSANIESESSRYNLNMILAPFASPSATPSPNPSASPNVPPAGATGGTGATGDSGFNPDAAREALGTFLGQIIQNKFEADPDFGREYSDLRVEDLTESIVAWADWTFEKRSGSGREVIPSKGAPFYSLSELHMIYPIDDQLYDLLAPNFTVATTPGININTMKEPMLKALFPRLIKEEVEEFFKFRDSDTEDNLFKNEDEFFKYAQNNFSTFRNDPEEVRRFKEDLNKRGIRLVTDESLFKITVQAKVNQATRLIEAWVTLNKPQPGGTGTGTTGTGTPPPGGVTQAPPRPDSGLKITFMRIL